MKNFSRKKAVFRSFTAGLGFFAFGYSIGIFTSSQTCVSSILNWGDNSQLNIALMSAMIPFGAILGSLCAGFISMRFGKRQSLMMADCITLLGSLISYWPNTISFGVGRFICGAGIGCFSMLSSGYIAEFTPSAIIASMGSMNSFYIMSGVLVSNCVCLALPLGNCSSEIKYWVFLIFTAPGLASFIQFIILWLRFKKESPYWLLKSGQYELALKSYESIYDRDYAEGEVKKHIEKEKNNSESVLLQNYEPSYKDLLCCKEGTTKAMRVGVFFHIFQQLSGINAMVFYSTLVFEDMGEGVLFSRILTICGGLIRAAGLIVFLPFVDKVSKKKVTIFSLFSMGCSYLVLAFTVGRNDLKIMLVIFIFLYFLIFSISMGPITWMYSGLVMPDKGISLAVAVNWSFAAGLVFVFPFLISWFGLGYTFLLLAIFNIIGSVYFALDMVDSTGLSKVEMKKILSKMR